MSTQNNQNQRGGGSSFSPILGLLAIAFVFIALFYVSKLIFTILSWVAPILLIVTFFINRQVIFDYGKWIVKLVKQNPIMGIGAGVLSVLGFPFLSAFLFGKAMLYRKVGKLREDIQKKTDGEFVNYEEVEDDDFLVLDDIEDAVPKQKPEIIIEKTETNDYDDLFK